MILKCEKNKSTKEIFQVFLKSWKTFSKNSLKNRVQVKRNYNILWHIHLNLLVTINNENDLAYR